MTLLESLFRTLLEISLPMTAVVALLLLLRPLLQKHYRAKWMYWVWLLLAVRLIVPVNIPLPEAPIAVSNPGMTIYQRDTNRTLPGHSDLVLLTPEKHADVVRQEAMQASMVADPAGDGAQNEYRPLITLSQSLALLWVAGFCAVLLWEGVSYARFRRRVRRWQSPLEDARFEALKAEIGVTRLALAQCSAISSPMVTGFVHPTLLLPEADAPEAVLRHELVHAKRHDLWYKLLLVFARAVHWFNPLVWLMARQASQDLELSCDEAVVKGRDEDFRAGYGKAILDAVDSGRGRENAPLTTYFHGGKRAMLERLQSIISTKVKRRGAIALGLALVLTLSASAFCAISQPMQKVDGGSYTLNVPADVTVKLTEEMPEGFTSSYYEVELTRNGSFAGDIKQLIIPGFADMTRDEYADVLHPAQRDLVLYTSPGGLKGAKMEYSPLNIPPFESYYITTDDDYVWALSFSRLDFSRAEVDAIMASLMVGSIPTPNPKGDFTLTVDFTEDEALWHLWDTSRSPSLLGTANIPAKYRIWAAPLWSEDGKWAAVPSGDGGLRWNYRIFGMGKEGFEQNFPVLLTPDSLMPDYIPVPDTLELRATGFVGSPFPDTDFPALALSYSLLDTDGNLQSGSGLYSCYPPATSARPIGWAPLMEIKQNPPLVPTVWQDGGHSFSLLLTEGSTVSTPDEDGARTFTGPNGEYLGQIYKVQKEDAWNGAYRASTQSYYSAWLDEADGLCYQLEVCETDLPLYVSTRMVYSLTMDGKLIDFYYENQIAK